MGQSTFLPPIPTHLPVMPIPVQMPPDELSDKRLAAAVVELGSHLAFRELYERHTPHLYRLALRMSATREDADDALQESWLRAATGLRKFAWQSSLRTWLFGITLNVLREQLARSGRGIDLSLEEVTLVAKPEGEVIDLEAAVSALPPGARAVFLLHDVEGFTHEEIATQLGVTSGTSKRQLHRARRALRQQLKEYQAMEES